MRTILALIYGVSYVLYSIPFLIKAKKVNRNELSRKEYNEIVHKIPKKFGRNFLKMCGCEVIVNGEEKLPETPYLIVGNHPSDIDIFVYLGYIKEPFGFVSKIEVKKIPIVRSWMKVMDCLFLDRDDRRQSVKTFRQGIQLLKEGHPIAIYPEGTRSLGREMLPFKSGSFSLAKKANVPVIPVMVDGTYDTFEKNKFYIKPTTIYLTYCDPIYPDDYENMSLNDLATETQGRIQQAIDEVKRDE